jgi:hypothetical protein
MHGATTSHSGIVLRFAAMGVILKHALLLKKEARTSTRLPRTSRRQPRKSFLVLFFQKKNCFLT